MSVTNKLGLPKPLVDAVNFGWYVKAGHISVTSLLKSPRQRWLMERHGHEVVEDASDRIWALLGSAVHSILQKSHDGHLVEERLRASVNGWTLTGQADLLDSDMTLSDYKVTSVWSFVYADHVEWEQQLNVYAWLYAQHGFDVKSLQIVGILRDWQRRKRYESGYPPDPVSVLILPLWSPERQAAFVSDRIALHQQAESLADAELPPCSPAEQWRKPTTWAVMCGGKRALRLYETRDAADAHAESVGGRVECRPGVAMKCESYCSVRRWCSQADAESAA